MKKIAVVYVAVIAAVGCNQNASHTSTSSAIGSSNPLETNSISQPDRACLDVDQFSAVGTICKTSQGVTFKRVADGWLDTTSNLTWYDFKSPQGVTRFQAEAFCKSHGLVLPTGYSKDNNGRDGFPINDSDFISAESHGIREVLKDTKGFELWSSSSWWPIVDEEAFYFYSDSGTVYHTDYAHAAINGYAGFVGKCVSPINQVPPNNPESSKWGEILRDQGGRIIFIYSQKDAKQTCADMGMHLPTAREVALLSTDRGAKGILEVNDVENKYGGKLPSGFSLIKAKESDGRVDRFYFNAAGYTRPSYEMERYCYWTSSVNPDYPPPAYDHKVTFNPSFGSIDDDVLYDGNDWAKCAIRCAR